MPTAHRIALKKLFATIGKRIKADEARLLDPMSDEERNRLIQEIADLKIRHRELKQALVADQD